MKKTILFLLPLSGLVLDVTAGPGSRNGGVVTCQSPELVMRGRAFTGNLGAETSREKPKRVALGRSASSFSGRVGLLEILSPSNGRDVPPASASRLGDNASPTPGRKAIVSASSFVQLGKKILQEDDPFVAAGMLQVLSHESDPVLLGILTLAGGTVVDKLRSKVESGEGDLGDHDRAFMLLFGMKVLDVETEKDLIGLGPEITRKRKEREREVEEEERWQKVVKRDMKKGFYPVSLRPGKDESNLSARDQYRASVLPLPPLMP